MPAKPTNPAEKEYKKQIAQWLSARNRCTSAWSFKRITTYEDLLYEALGQDRQSLRTYYPTSQLAAPITHQQVIDFFEPFKQTIEWNYKQSNGGPVWKCPEPTAHEYEGCTYTPGQILATVSSSTTVPTTNEREDKADETPIEELPPCDRQKATLLYFQTPAVKKLLDGILKNKYHGQLLRAEGGAGKTYIIGAVDARLKEFCVGKTFSPWAKAYITRASIVEQTKRVLEKQFTIDTVNETQVINIEQLRSSFGELMVRSETIVERGEEHIKWKWRPNLHPTILYLDECQAVKNTDSQQSQILQAFNDISAETYQIHFSATPFMRVCEAKCFAVSTRLKFKMGNITYELSNETWPMFSKMVAHPAEPEEYSPAAIERLMVYLEPYVVDVKNVRSQFHAINKVEMIDFQTQEERDYYNKAWERYEEIKRKIEGYDLSGTQSRFLILAQFTVFRKAAELCRAPYFAEFAHETVQKGQAACIAVSFKGTIRKWTDILVNKFGVSRDDIMLVWGGGKTVKSKKQKAKENVTNNAELQKILKDAGLGLGDLNLEYVADYIDDEIEDPALRLGTQSMKERQKEVDRYQCGKARYGAFTFKAGGVGLSLHHTDEFTKEKVRRKKNGYAIEEDIPKIPTRQRVGLLGPTFSAIEMAQGLWRLPRITSLSDTSQSLIFYRGTIEERVAAITSLKLRCLRKVVRNRESWEDIIVGGVPDSERHYTPAELNSRNEPDEPDEEVDGFFGSDEDEEEE